MQMYGMFIKQTAPRSKNSGILALYSYTRCLNTLPPHPTLMEWFIFGMPPVPFISKVQPMIALSIRKHYKILIALGLEHRFCYLKRHFRHSINNQNSNSSLYFGRKDISQFLGVWTLRGCLVHRIQRLNELEWQIP